MSENENIKYPQKSERYKGVYQRKNGTWFYRIKLTNKKTGEVKYIQKSGFTLEKEAYDERMKQLSYQCWLNDGWTGEKFECKRTNSDIKFSDSFAEFLDTCQSESSKKKYTSIYHSQLSIWADKRVIEIGENDIEFLLFRLALKGNKHSYISSIRKVVKLYFQFARHEGHTIAYDMAQLLPTKPYKLKVLSLFSGIGAPERALENLGIDYELINYCEFDNRASYAYSLLHNVDMGLDLIDVEEVADGYAEQSLPDFDIMFFGSPCQDLSRQGPKKGLLENKEDKLPTTWQLKEDDLPELTRSGLIYRALQIALIKKPKLMIAENVDNFISKMFIKEFRAVVRNLQDIGYNFYYKKLVSSDFGVPQHRSRVFMVMVRDDINIKFEWPQPTKLEVMAKDWFLPPEEVPNSFYIKKVEKLERDSWRPNYKEDIISCITTKWGEPDPHTQQTFVKDSKGIRCLTSKELMRFQGFPTEYANTLLDNGFNIGEIGKLVGNSITVPVIQAIIKQLISGVKENKEREIEGKVIEARTDNRFIDPLFAYMGNKSKLLPYIDYLFPIHDEFHLYYTIFVDVFAGSGAVGVNTKAGKVILNDIDPFLINIYKGLSSTPPDKAWELVMNVVNKYSLSSTNEEGYKLCRAEYNKIPFEERGHYWYWGLALVYHSFNRSHISHNSNKEFNSSFGGEKVDLKLSKKRFFPFARALYKGNFEFSNKSYKDIVIEGKCLDEEVFYYFDPPYLASEATYNKGWSELDEIELYEFIDKCPGKWMLSNVLENNGKRNEILADWIKTNKNKYSVYYLNRSYKNSTYNRKNEGETVEVIITSESPHAHF